MGLEGDTWPGAGSRRRGSPWSCVGDDGGGGIASGYSSNIGYGSGENNYRLGATGLGRNIGPGEATTSPFASSPGDFEQSYGDLYGANSRFGDAPWQSASSKIDGSASFNYELGPTAESTVRSSEEYVGSYNIASRQANRGNSLLQHINFEKLSRSVYFSSIF
uniref:Uncharacterized protein n=1 Tax=Daucus carota subsp. sativus TaxID=79200 RepID=A0A162A1V5_DAUCS